MSGPVPINTDPPPTRLAIYINAMVYPGIGQLMQGRMLAGSVITILTGGLFVVAVILLIPIFKTYYIQLANFSQTPDSSVTENWRPLVAILIIWIAVYTYSIVDAVRGFQNQYRDWALRQHGLDTPG
jgi:TM2 domain-containing membrane protein YozV